MSKVDAMRALREARYAATTKAGGAVVKAAVKPVAAKAPAVQASTPTAPAPDAVCGHRNMGGKSCTRELDHAKNGTKNHRYG